MIIVSWNIRGMGAKIKRSSLRKIINTKKPHFTFLQETKLESIDQKIIKTCWNSDDSSWEFSPASGKSGGILSVWDKKYFNLESIKIEKHWIAMCGVILSKNFKCMLINVYNPCNIDLRKEVWSEIEAFWVESKIPSLVMGDLNEVVSKSERGSQNASIPGMADFKDFIHKTELLDIPPSNGLAQGKLQKQNR